MVCQLLRRFWHAVARKIVCRAHHRHPHIRRDAHRNHVFGDLFAEAHARIKTTINDIRQAVVDGDLNVNIRVLQHKGFQHRPQHRRHGVLPGGNANVPGGFVTHLAQGRQFLFDLQQVWA
ncbi:hypothetical protein D3C81_1691080 [compost metagenome]